MQSNRERIRAAVQRALGRESRPDTTRLETELDFQEATKQVESGKLPERIIAKVPQYLEFLRRFVLVANEKQLSIDIVLSNRTLVYDDPDFALYLIFLVRVCRERGDTNADNWFRLLNIIHNIGLIYG